MKRSSHRLVSLAVTLGLSLIILIPLSLILLGAMKNGQEAAEMTFSLPSQWRLFANVTEVLNSGNTLVGFWNSTLLGILVTGTCLLLSFVGGFTVARRTRGGFSPLYLFFLFGMIVPGNIVANYYLMKMLGLYGNLVSVVILQSVGMIPFCVILISGYIKGIPREIDESAWLEGCGTGRFLTQVFAPLCKPILATCAIIIFLTSWNDFMTPLYFLIKAESYTVSLSLFYFIGTYSREWNLVFTDVLLVSLPVILFYLFLQRFIISGLTEGSVKG